MVHVKDSGCCMDQHLGASEQCQGTCGGALLMVTCNMQMRRPVMAAMNLRRRAFC